MFDAKVGIRRYKFKNDLEWQLAMTMYDDACNDLEWQLAMTMYDACNDLCDTEIEDLQMMFEDALEQQGVKIVYAVP